MTKRAFLLLSFCFLIGFSFAAWLDNMPMTMTQPDGSKLSCFASGDEYHNWLHDADGFTIMRNPRTGFWVYATGTRGSLTASAFIPGQSDPKALGLTPRLNISEAEYKEMRRSKFPMPTERDAPTSGTINNLVIFIRFADETEFTDNLSTYTGWFNTGTSSQKGYFLEASYNQLTVNTSFYPTTASSTVLSWQDSHNRAYFQPYDATTNPTGYNGDTERRTREFTLLQNATAGVASQIPSSLTIDSDGDGRVDNVVFVIKGSAGAWSSLLWPHRWSLYDRYVYINGKRVYDFNLQLQTFLAGSNVGVLCHEFFHTLGAPDLYHYTDNGITPAGSWDLMESNGNPPHHMLAFMKYKYGDWISSIPTISASGQYTLNALTSSTNNCYRINSPNSSTEYFIVEYRRDMGTYESSIPGSGLLVYRINTSAGDGNADGPPDEVYIYRPGGTTTVDGTISSANYSQETGRTRINAETNPTPFLSDGSAGGLSIYNIGSAAGETITFNLGIPPVITIDFTTNPTIESFDGTLFPPDGWNSVTLSGSYNWQRYTSGTNPTCSPQSGAGMLGYNSYNASAGSAVYLASPKIAVTQVSGALYTFSFSIFRDGGYANNLDRVEIYTNTTANLDGTPTLLGTINRSITQSPIVSSNAWYTYTYSLPFSTTGYYYVIVKAISAYGNRTYLDNFSFYKEVIPLTASTFSPADLSLEQAFSTLLSWSGASGVISGYRLNFGTNNPPTNIYNGLQLGNVSSYQVTGLAPLTDYYWQVVPYNNAGDALSCPVKSFKTTLAADQIRLGTGTLLNTDTGYPAPYGNWYWGAKHQMLIPVAELNAVGIVGPGYINSLAFDVETIKGTPLQSFTIKLGHLSTPALTTWQTDLTTVYGPQTFTETRSWNIHQFTTPFLWNGVSDLVIETCFQNSSYTRNAIMRQTATGYVSTILYRADAANVGSATQITSSLLQRPNMAFTFIPRPQTVTNLQVTHTGTQVSLSWTPVPDATSYLIYASDTPNPADWGSPIAEVLTPSFPDTPQTRRFYRIVTKKL